MKHTPAEGGNKKTRKPWSVGEAVRMRVCAGVRIANPVSKGLGLAVSGGRG
jgi:hypothetical protein